MAKPRQHKAADELSRNVKWHRFGAWLTSLLSMTAVAAKCAVAISRLREQVGIGTRDPRTIEHFASHISLNEFEKEIELGPGQRRTTNDSKSIARATIKCGSPQKGRSGSLPRVGLDVASHDGAYGPSLLSHFRRPYGYNSMDRGSGPIYANELVGQ